MREGKLSRELEWFVCTLASEFGVLVSTREVAVEAVELGIEEVDACFLPFEIPSNSAETYLYELMIVDDAASNEWLGAIAFCPNSPEWLLQLITKNGELLYRRQLPVPILNSTEVRRDVH